MSKSLYLYHGDSFKDLDKCPICKSSRYKNNAGYYGGDIEGLGYGNKRKRKGARNSVISVKPRDTTLDISEKQSRIPAMVMWHLLVANRLRSFFSNPNDAELMLLRDSDKPRKGNGKLQHPADAR
jgi:hypothetical protein